MKSLVHFLCSQNFVTKYLLLPFLRYMMVNPKASIELIELLMDINLKGNSYDSPLTAFPLISSRVKTQYISKILLELYSTAPEAN